jgi:hypothetical protein
MLKTVWKYLLISGRIFNKNTVTITSINFFPSSKYPGATGGLAQVVEHLLSKHKTLISNTSTDTTMAKKKDWNDYKSDFIKRRKLGWWSASNGRAPAKLSVNFWVQTSVPQKKKKKKKKESH